MKKIVALVLTLVLALSLATVAFAGTTSYLANELDIKYADGHMAKVYAKDTDYWTLSLEKVKAADAAKKTVDVYQVFYNFSADKKVPFPAAYVLATEDDFDVVFVQGGTTTYLSNALLANYTGEATPIEAVALDDADEAVCGDYVSDEALYLYNGKVMFANNEINWNNGLDLGAWMSDIKNCQAIALVDGKLVTLTAATKGDLTVTYKKDGTFKEATISDDAIYAKVGHTYTAAWSVAADGTLKVSEVSCKNCPAKFDFVVGEEKDALKAFGVGNYAAMTTDKALEKALDGDQIWIKIGELDGAAADTNKGVDSAKTFDAGVVLYAGMALMSVAGSAVVIGKKKEF